jgi:hypothetical protein
MSRPDYIACVQKPKSAIGYCGNGFGFFTDTEHVRLNREQQGRLVGCPVCLNIIGETELAKSEALLIGPITLEDEEL